MKTEHLILEYMRTHKKRIDESKRGESHKTTKPVRPVSRNG